MKKSVALLISSAGAMLVFSMLGALLLITRPSQGAIESAASRGFNTAPEAGVEPANDEVAAGVRLHVGLRLAEQPGGACQAWLSGSLLPLAPDVDRAITAAGGPGHWLESDIAWIGDRASALVAFGATWAAEDGTRENLVWIETREGDATVLAKQLKGDVTPAGNLVWRVTSTARVAPCSQEGE